LLSWYEESQLTLIEHDRKDLLEKWEREAKEEADEKSDLDWIFSHGKEVLERPHGASVQALANCFGLTNLWGSRGEGIVYYENMARTLSAAAPFLVAGDKAAWLSACQKTNT